MRHWKIIGAIVSVAFWLGCQLSGFTYTPLAILLWVICVVLLGWSAWPLRKRISVKKRGRKMLIVLGALLIVAGLGMILFQLEFHKSSISKETGNLTPTHITQPNTVVRCCLRGNTYQIWAQNGGDKEDTVVITLGTSGLITDWHPIMGASLPTKIEGGINANFITFKIDELIPDMSLGYIVETSWNAEEPHKFTAWSEKSGNISAICIGKCPEVVAVGPEETRPP